jgi:HAD superfamily hydrolase (TIGR01549 family)
MQTYHITWPVRALIFDMDNTLYTNARYARHQEDVLVARLAEELHISVEAATEQVRLTRARLTQANQGSRPSLATVFLHLGVPIATSALWRAELITPEKYLVPDPELARAMASLSAGHGLAVVTNNPVATAQRTLAVLGIDALIPFVVGLDSTGVSKPAPQAFRLAGERLGCPFAQIVSVGDRFEIDIKPALDLGMGGILVDGVDDVYRLPAFLAAAADHP